MFQKGSFLVVDKRGKREGWVETLKLERGSSNLQE
jgi:hypothetical protein